VNAGTGLTGGGAAGDVTLQADLGGTGSATTVARSDHDHDAAYVNEGQPDSINSAMIVDGTVGDSDLEDGAALAEIGDDDGAGSGLDADLLDGEEGSTYRDASLINAGTLGTDYYSAYADLSAEGKIGTGSDQVAHGDHDHAGSYWALSGNAGTTAGTHFLGTTDDQALELHVNGSRALRLEPNATSPNLIGGHSGNSVTEEVVGAAIGGGGIGGNANRVTDNYGTVGGGTNNQAGDDAGATTNSVYATVGGGAGNIASGNTATVAAGWFNTANDTYAAVGGGSLNTASGFAATVGGGASNTASGDYATVGGGQHNTASGNYATVGGGEVNTAGGDHSFAAGWGAQANHDGTFVWADSTAVIFGSTGTDQFLIRAAGGVGVGNNAPLTQLHVKKNVSGSAVIGNHVAAIENTSTDSSPDVLALKVNIASPTGGTNFVSFRDSTGFVGAIEGDGSGGITYKSGGGDFAEYLPRLDSAEALAPGDIVGLFAGGVSRATEGARRALVVSTAPIVLGNRPDAGEEGRYVPIALLGQVPVRVRGGVRAGDYIVPSGRADGTGVAVPPGEITAGQAAQVVGRALEGVQAGDVSPVKTLVGLSQGEILQTVLEGRDTRIRDLEARVAALEATVNSAPPSPSGLPSLPLLLGGLLVLVVAVGQCRPWGGEP
jgi:hypothetical protein